MHRSWTVVPLVAALIAAGCASDDSATRAATREPSADIAPANSAWSGVSEAICVLAPLGRSHKVHGVVRFVDVDGGVRIIADVDELRPNARHAFHIHEFGDCTSPDGKSAGAHYDPEHAPHGGPDAGAHHAGDFGNLETDAKGHAHYDRVVHGITVAGDRDPIVGRSVIVHAGEDDLTTQPSGNAGDRIACGVIGVAKPAAK
jgi:superoxide dismutase, Cu-Zn family